VKGDHLLRCLPVA